MAKVQGKKKAVAPSRRVSRKVAAGAKRVARAIKKKVVVRKPVLAKAGKKAIPKVVAKVTRSARKSSPRPVAVTAQAPKTSPKTAAKATPKAVPKIAAARGAAVPKAAPEPRKTRSRRMRPNLHSSGAPVAAWLPQGVDKPRPSSFIPAPPRAEAPSLIAAPPASSDRLIRPEDVTEFVTRTVPVRVDVEQGGGRVFISVNPEEVTLGRGEGIEWDFRYLGGSDVAVDELVIEFDKPSPFSATTFKSRKPGAARPHRQLSGPVQKSAAGKRIPYTIRAVSAFKAEMARRTLYLNVQP